MMHVTTALSLLLLVPLSGCFVELSSSEATTGAGVLALEVANVEIDGETARVTDLSNGIVTDTGGYIITGLGCPDLLAEVRIEGGGQGEIEPFDLSMALNIHGFSSVNQFADVYGTTLAHGVTGDELFYGPHEAVAHSTATEEEGASDMGFVEDGSLLDPATAVPAYYINGGVYLNFDVAEYGSRPLLSNGYYGPAFDPYGSGDAESTRAVLARFDGGSTEGAHRVSFRAINEAGREVRGSFELVPVDTDDVHYVNGQPVGVYGGYF